MYPLLRTTPVAGTRFTKHLKQLVLHFGSYKPPLATLGGSANLPSTTQLNLVPEEILTDELIEEIKTQCCFIGEPVEVAFAPIPAAPVVPSSDAMSVDETSVPPSSDAPSGPSRPSSPVHAGKTTSTLTRDTYWESIAATFQKHSTARDLSLKVNPPGIGAPTGRGTLIIPGWVRERAAEVLFEGGDLDESSVAEVILDCLMRVGHWGFFGLSLPIYDWVSGSVRPAKDAHLLDSYRWWDCNATRLYISTTKRAIQNSETAHN